ncbi:hypothetical protein TNCV_954311 [Trichonephila clavipes]|nr:hypothetical protein TNCV_954311 [Trichonephila clavipes]
MPSCRACSMYLQTSMCSPGFERKLYGTAVSLTNPYTIWATDIHKSSLVMGFMILNCKRRRARQSQFARSVVALLTRVMDSEPMGRGYRNYSPIDQTSLCVDFSICLWFTLTH